MWNMCVKCSRGRGGYVTAHTVGLVAAFLEWEGVEGNELLQERAV